MIVQTEKVPSFFTIKPNKQKQICFQKKKTETNFKITGRKLSHSPKYVHTIYSSFEQFSSPVSMQNKFTKMKVEKYTFPSPAAIYMLLCEFYRSNPLKEDKAKG